MEYFLIDGSITNGEGEPLTEAELEHVVDLLMEDKVRVVGCAAVRGGLEFTVQFEPRPGAIRRAGEWCARQFERLIEWGHEHGANR